jgi:peptide/nickel transport system substrate-binding protein
VVACDLLRAAGFVVDLQAMDMSTLQARRAQQHGWHMFATYGAWWARTAPVSENALSAAGYPNAWFGWPSDPELESLRDDFARAETENQRAVLAERIQVRAMEVGTHVPLGEFRVMTATRTNVTGFVTGYNFTAYWNVQKR